MLLKYKLTNRTKSIIFWSFVAISILIAILFSDAKTPLVAIPIIIATFIAPIYFFKKTNPI